MLPFKSLRKIIIIIIIKISKNNKNRKKVIIKRNVHLYIQHNI